MAQKISAKEPVQSKIETKHRVFLYEEAKID